MGQRNWLFAWTELGAKHIGIVQSLLVTCRLHDIDPYTYFVDVLHRIGQHPASQVHQLTPRLWKERYASNPLHSDLHNIREHQSGQQRRWLTAYLGAASRRLEHPFRTHLVDQRGLGREMTLAAFLAELDDQGCVAYFATIDAPAMRPLLLCNLCVFMAKK